MLTSMTPRIHLTQAYSSPNVGPTGCRDGDSPLGTLCSLTSAEPATSAVPPGAPRFQEVLFAAQMEGTQCLGHRHIPCRQPSRASSWEDGVARGRCLEPQGMGV